MTVENVKPWTRRSLIERVVALALARLMPGALSAQAVPPCSTSIAGQANPQPVPSGPLTVASVTVASSSAGSVPLSFLGLSFDKASIYDPIFTSSNANLIALFQSLGPGVLRIGGNSVDQTVWNQNGGGQTVNQVAPSDVSAFGAFLKATGWKCIYGINLGGASNGSTNTMFAAQEVMAASTALGSSLMGIEIGNEPDQWGNAGSYFAGNWSLPQFETLWTTYQAAVASAVPGVKFVGPDAAANSYSWTLPFAQQETSKLSLVTQHYYRGDGNSTSSTAAQLITPDTTLTGDDLTNLSTATSSTGLPYRVDECNSYYDGGSEGVSNSYASTLWVIDFLFNLAQYGASGANFQGGPGGYYSPINITSGGVVQGVNPMFYGMKFFTYAGAGTLNTTTIKAGALNATAYTVKTASGGLNVVISNKDSTQNLQVNLQLPQTVNTATLMLLTQRSSGASAPSLAALSGVTLQGGTIGLGGSVTLGTLYTLAPNGTQLTCYVPALSAVLVQIT